MKSKLTCTFLAIVMILSLGTSIYANEASGDGEITYIEVDSLDDVDWDKALPNEVYLAPSESVDQDNSMEFEPVLYGTGIPSSVYDLTTTNGHYFSGKSSTMYSTLYSKYKFTGAKVILLYVDNLSSGFADLKVAVEPNKNITFTVPLGKTAGRKFQSTGDTEWYISFAPIPNSPGTGCEFTYEINGSN